MKQFWPILILAFLFFLLGPFSSNSYGKGKSKIMHSLPAGIIFPMFNSAALINPSRLALEKARSLQGLYSFPPNSNTAHAYEFSVASASKRFGLGLGYQGSTLNSNLTHGGFIGAGYNIDMVSLGLNLRDANLEGNLNPDVDFAMNIELEKSIHFGLILRRINRAARLDAGIGYGKKKSYNLELNLLAPTFSDMGGNNYTLSISAATYVDMFGFSFRTDYHLSPKAFDYQIAGLLWVSDRLHFLAKFTSPDLWTLGITLVI